MFEQYIFSAVASQQSFSLSSQFIHLPTLILQQSRGQTIEAYLNSNSQVDETVYCGGIEAAQNQNLLCRLNIEYIVDLSGQEDDPTLANSRSLANTEPKLTSHPQK
jgi:hypothetical protein